MTINHYTPEYIITSAFDGRDFTEDDMNWYLMYYDGTIIHEAQSTDAGRVFVHSPECFVPRLYSSLKDKKGRKIYDMDVVDVYGERGLVRFSGACFYVLFPSHHSYLIDLNKNASIVGNKWQEKFKYLDRKVF